MSNKNLIIYTTLAAVGGSSLVFIPSAQAFNPMNPGSWFGGDRYDDDDYYYDRYYDGYGPYGRGPYGWGGPYGGYGPYGYGYPGYGYGAPGYQQQQNTQPAPPPLPQ